MTTHSPITTHVLNTATGKPANGVLIRLERKTDQGWEVVGEGETNADGRLLTLLPEGALVIGDYRIHFDSARYFGAMGQATFFPSVCIEFRIDATDEHYHVPLLLSPFGYSTYRGS
jgi:5-hydroxyisourate hydrolase